LPNDPAESTFILTKDKGAAIFADRTANRRDDQPWNVRRLRGRQPDGNSRKQAQKAQKTNQLSPYAMKSQNPGSDDKVQLPDHLSRITSPRPRKLNLG
jgi:hypothetical protein